MSAFPVVGAALEKASFGYKDRSAWLGGRFAETCGRSSLDARRPTPKSRSVI